MHSNGSSALYRGILVIASVFALLYLSVGPASAGVGGAAGPTWPATLAVGDAVSANIDIVNASDGINASENVDILLITFTPSCAAQTVGTCTTPDPGVFTLAPLAVGDPSSSCGNTIFTLVGPAQGVYVLSPSAAVHLGPADGSGGAGNPSRCRIVLNATVSKLPIDSTPPNPPFTTIQFARAVLRGHTSQSTGSANGQATIAITPVSNLTATKSDGTPTYIPGSQVVYTIVAGNPSGPTDAMGAVVSDPKPAQVASWTWVCSGTTGGASGCDGAPSGSANFTDTVNLPVGSTITYTVTALIAGNATGSMTNTVTVTPPAGGTPGTATDIDTPMLQSDLTISKTDGDTVFPPGTKVYTVTVTNNGPSDANGAVVTDTKPSLVSSWTWVCSGSTGGASGCDGQPSGTANFSDTVNLPASSSITYTVTAALVSLVNTATVTPVGTTNSGTSCVSGGGVVRSFNAGTGACSSTDTNALSPSH
jgi:uncharacterized repeat protein (TIGR01451 family)